MKKIALILLATLATLAASAQSSTTIRATLRVEKQVVRVGPYARFAQKYLGAIAPLTDKRSIVVTDASLSTLQDNQAADIQPVASTDSPADVAFPSLPIDRRDFTARSLEEQAREAAATLFSLRKARIELVTGMAGENVFGDGLRAALEELDRLEAEYLALFMGKQSVEVSTRAFDIVPTREETTRVVCRFSPTEGILPADDLTGEPVVLEMRVVGSISTPVAAPARPSKNAPPSVRTLLPAQVDCRLFLNSDTLAAGRVAIFQKGVYSDIPVL